jgi:glycine/D-amino acid oxidase-like deaminating enzyme/nitrite reductase/ring-hydroxylating ferredoxin subunit
MRDELDTTSYWTDTESIPAYPALDRDLEVDAVIVGAGLTGLTAAYLLQRSGKRVAVLERMRVGGVDSMATTAHVTCVTDSSLAELVKNFGRDHAQAAWDAGFAAIEQIEAIVNAEGIDCQWKRVPGVKHLALAGGSHDDVEALQEEARLARELGFDAEFTDDVPFVARPAVVVAGQARFHPRKYLRSLAERTSRHGSYVFEQTPCDEVVDEPLSVKARGRTITCKYIVLATHTPLMGKTNIASATLLQTKLYLYTSYVVGGRVAKGTVPDMLFWDTASPYHYLRVDERTDHDYVVFGGNDHKTGQADDTRRCFERLEAAARRAVPSLDVTHRWSGQVVETNDGLPFIGESSSRQFAATGYAGNGMTFGTLAGMMAHDACMGQKNPWRELFDLGRTKVRGGAWDYLKENVDYPYYMIRDRIVGAEGTSLRALQAGEGKVLEIDGERVAAARGADGSVTMVSPVCTHMGCLVEWNRAEKTWDCPCHGSRFLPDGKVLAGPAETPLQAHKGVREA